MNLQPKNNRILQMLGSVTALIVLGKLLGFVKQMVTAAAFGATLETDIINLAQGLISNLDYLLIQTMVTALVSVYIHTQAQGEETSRHFAFQAFKAFSLIAAAVTGLVLLLASPAARLLAPSYDAASSARLAGYLRLFAPALLLLVWTALFNALLHAERHFLPEQLVNIFQSVWMILLVFLLKDRLGAASMAAAFLVYAVWNALYTAILSRRYWTVCGGNPFHDENIRWLLRMMLPLLLGYSLVFVNQLVDKLLVSGLVSGAVTALSYAAVLSNLVGTFITTFASIFFTYVTARIARAEREEAAELTGQAAEALLLAFTPVALLTVLCAEDIVAIVYGRGAFTAESAALCTAALCGYALMFPPLALREVYSRFLYGYQDSRRPMINSSIGILCNIALSVALCPRYGVLGVTFATSVSVAVCATLNLRSARRTHPEISLRPLFSLIPGLFAGCAVCGVAAWWCRSALIGQGSLVRFVLTALAGFTAYGLILLPRLLRFLRALRGRHPAREEENS